MATSHNKGSEFIKGNPYTCFTHPARHEGLQAVFGAPSQFAAGFGGGAGCSGVVTDPLPWLLGVARTSLMGGTLPGGSWAPVAL